MTYIRGQLLPDELLAAQFVFMDTRRDLLQLANFGMPELLGESFDGHIRALPGNNMPIMSFLETSAVDTYRLSTFRKLLIYSDGLEEAAMGDGRLYVNALREDFAAATCRKGFVEQMRRRVPAFEDDMVFLWISTLPEPCVLVNRYEICSTIEAIDEFVVFQLPEFLVERGFAFKELTQLQCALNELMVNAFEHGNLGIGHDQKHLLLESHTFDEFVVSRSGEPGFAQKKIWVEYGEIEGDEMTTVVMTVTDQGAGFDVQRLMKKLVLEKSLHLGGRGIRMCEQLLDGLYYKDPGNAVVLVKNFSWRRDDH